MDVDISCLAPQSRFVRSQRCRYRTSILSACCVLLVLHAFGGATAFMLPTGTCKSKSWGTRSIHGRRLAAMRLLGSDASSRMSKRGLLSRVRTTSPAVSTSAAEGDTSTASSSSNSSRGRSAPEPVVYAQEVLDLAWRSQRRIAAQGKSKPLRQRFMSAFGGRSAVFVEDRDFMEETLDNVVRVRQRLRGWCLREGHRRAVNTDNAGLQDDFGCCCRMWRCGLLCSFAS